jgi:capsid protein
MRPTDQSGSVPSSRRRAVLPLGTREGYDAEEVDRRIAADHAREEELGLKFGRSATARAEPAAEVDPEDRERPMQSEENAA